MNQNDEKKILSTGVLIGIQVLIVILTFTLGGLTYHVFFRYHSEFGLLSQAKDILEDHAYHDLPEQKDLEYGMIRGMLGTLNDPYTNFVEPAAHEVQSNDLAGNFGGIGARLERDTQMNWRLYPLPDSPSSEAGIHDGDLLLGVDGLKVTSETDDVTLLAALRGEIDSKVTLTIQRGTQVLTMEIKRQSVALPSVSYNLLPEETQTGFLKINRIAETTADEIETGIRELQNQGAQAFILDLRDNGGGLVDAGIEIARLFLSEGDIIRHQVKGQEIEIFRVEEPGPFTEVPLVTLVNQNTASSAEIVAGAFKSQDRSVLIGMPTFGKTTIQFVFDLQDGSSIHVTSGQWWVDDIEFPLMPDIEIAVDPTEGALILQAIKVLENDIK